jgi:hypothetical protein
LGQSQRRNADVHIVRPHRVVSRRSVRLLNGCLHYFAAIDRESSSMVNVSVWRSLADAQQMQTLAPMRALAEEFTREGVRFERPIINYETLWQID